jgi:3-isopropylmalate/(R)-2-methylmalate dehydratase small subunit
MSSIIRQVMGTGVCVSGDDIDTDRIIPARFLKEITFSQMGNYAFYDARFDESGTPKSHPFNDPTFEKASLLFVGKNFGCGSSREHAPQALMRYGIKAIVGESFAEIFAGNCSAIGVPVVIVSYETSLKCQEQLRKNPNTVFILNLSDKKIQWDNTALDVSLPESRRQAFLAGTWEASGLLKQNHDKIIETANRLPYLHFQTRV